MTHNSHEHISVASQFDEAQRYPEIRKVTIVGAIINVALAAAKVAFGIMGHSQALIADGIHSFSDLATDALVLIGAKQGSRDADADHPYGHGRFETAATVALGTLLIIVGLGISIDAAQRLLFPGQLFYVSSAARHHGS